MVTVCVPLSVLLDGVWLSRSITYLARTSSRVDVRARKRWTENVDSKQQLRSANRGNTFTAVKRTCIAIEEVGGTITLKTFSLQLFKCENMTW